MAWLFESANGEGEPEVNKKIVRSKDIAFSRNAKRLGHYIEAQGNNTKDGMAEVGMVRHNLAGRPTRVWCVRRS